jgi:hypothetical protein
MMALHGFVFAKTDKEWRIVMSQEDQIEVEAQTRRGHD